MSSNSENLVGYKIYNRSSRDLIDNIIEVIKENRSPAYLACFNPHSYAVSKTDLAFAASLHGANWLVPDGSGVVLASKILGGAINQRITGADVFEGLHRFFNQIGGVKVFFLGSSDANLAEIRRCMRRDFPNVQVVGVYSPPFSNEYSDIELQDMTKRINDSGAQVLWVGMTAPKQEKWIMQNLDSLNISFAAAIGAVFDFYTGHVRRPSQLFRDSGLEWLPRLMREPRRLWRRTLISAPIFLADVLRQRFDRKSLL